MEPIFLAPWLPPAEPDLARLAMEAADEAGVLAVNSWPERRKGGIGFGTLPPFLPWRGQDGAGQHLVLLQVREVGALVPGARTQALPAGWLQSLDLAALAAPLARHPDLGGAASIHVVQLSGPGQARVRSWGANGEAVVRAVLERVSGLERWSLVTTFGS